PSSSPWATLPRLARLSVHSSEAAEGGGRREGSRDHAARVRCPVAAGLHPGAMHPTPLGGNGSLRPLPPPTARFRSQAFKHELSQGAPASPHGPARRGHLAPAPGG